MRRWTVEDVMTGDVVFVTEATTYRQIVEALARNAVSAVPVVSGDNTVVGIVSEADLLHKMEFAGLEPHRHLLERKQRRAARAKAAGDTARDLMSSPAVSIRPGASLAEAAKTMDTERVKRLPVIDEQGHLLGIVSRSDLLRMYLRTDAAIRDEIRDQVLLHAMWIEPDTIGVGVEGGIVVLTGTADRRSTAKIAARLCEGVAGVVDVIETITYRYDDTADLHRHHVMGPTVKETTP